MLINNRKQGGLFASNRSDETEISPGIQKSYLENRVTKLFKNTKKLKCGGFSCKFYQNSDDFASLLRITTLKEIYPIQFHKEVKYRILN